MTINVFLHSKNRTLIHSNGVVEIIYPYYFIHKKYNAHDISKIEIIEKHTLGRNVHIIRIFVNNKKVRLYVKDYKIFISELVNYNSKINVSDSVFY